MIDNIFKSKYKTEAEAVRAIRDTVWAMSLQVDEKNEIIFLTIEPVSDDILIGNIKTLKNEVKKIIEKYAPGEDFWDCNVYLTLSTPDIVYKVWKIDFTIDNVRVSIH